MRGNIDWKKGGPSPNPNGRPPKAREAALLAISREICNAETWRQIFFKRVLDALGKKQVKNFDGTSTIEDDPNSHAGSRGAAFCHIRDMMIGRPAEQIRINDIENDPYAELRGYSDDEVTAVLAVIARIRSDGSSGELVALGAGEAAEAVMEAIRKESVSIRKRGHRRKSDKLPGGDSRNAVLEKKDSG